MRFHLPAVATALLLLGGIASAQPSNLRTMAAPHVAITHFRSFHLMPTPLRRDGARSGGAYDPMQNGSAANRVFRRIVSDEFVDRGYFDSEWMPDFLVAIYATTHDALDLSSWQYGYGYSPRWWSEGSGATSTSFEPGTVIVDVVDPETLDLLWRGTAVARIGPSDLANTNALIEAAIAVVDRFPHAKPIVVASRGTAPR